MSAKTSLFTLFFALALTGCIIFAAIQTACEAIQGHTQKLQQALSVAR